MEAYLNSLLTGSVGSAITKRNAVRFMVNLAELTESDDKSDLSMLNDVKAIMKRVEDTKNIGTQFNRLSIILKCIRLGGESHGVSNKAIKHYMKNHEELKPVKTAEFESNIMNSKQEAKFISLKDLDSILRRAIVSLNTEYGVKGIFASKADFNRLAKSDKEIAYMKKFQQLLIVSCYTMQPALRNNWSNLHIVTNLKATVLDNEMNYMLVNKAKKTITLIMNRYKNSKHMGQQFITIRPDLVKMLQQWFKLLNWAGVKTIKKPLMYSFYHDEIKLMDDSAVGKELPRITKRLIGKPVTINDFRHRWEEAIQSDDNYMKIPIPERAELHRELLHGFDIAQRYNLIRK